MAVSLTIKDDESDSASNFLLVETPALHRAKFRIDYSPAIAGHVLTFEDSQASWSAVLESGFWLAGEENLAVSQDQWFEFRRKLSDPSTSGTWFARMYMSNGIELSIEHDLKRQFRPEESVPSLLRAAFDQWIEDKTEDELLAGWDFPVSTLEPLEFLGIAEARGLRRAWPFLAYFTEVIPYGAAKLKEAASNGAAEGSSTMNYSETEWRVEEGAVASGFADRVGAEALLEVLRRDASRSD